jgi:isoprenylcysteine carboxyl methyltransferase (ICMT) family protein YpbQ
MHMWTYIAVAVAIRLVTLAISTRNEARLRAQGAVEIGAGNSMLLAAAHTAYYLVAIAEGAMRGLTFDTLAAVGLAIYIFGAVMLFVVIASLGRFWTVKVFLAPDHQLHRGWLFRAVRHPNYYLAILPELIGLALSLHAWWTLAVGLPLYLISLFTRIRQEEAAMAERFADYRAGGTAT